MLAKVLIIEDLSVDITLLNDGSAVGSDRMLPDCEGMREDRMDEVSFSELGFMPELTSCWLEP